MVTPRTARYLLAGVVAACISATAAVAVRDATRRIAPADAVTQPSRAFQIPSSTINLPIVIIGSGQAGASGGRVDLLPDTVPGGALTAPVHVPGS
jgi:hypothetical protein